MLKCKIFAKLNTLDLVLYQKMNVAEMYVIKTIKLGTQSKRCEEIYSHMVLATQIKYI